jgi:hypothetical protein
MAAKNKIIIALIIWLAASAFVFAYLFKMFDQANQDIIGKIAEQKKQLFALQAQQESFKLAQQDLKNLANKPVQPDNFFSQDVTLVKEIMTLENLGEKLNVNFSLNGLSGTIKNAPKVTSLSGLVSVPYGISLNGSFPRVVDFIETMENLNFITHLTSLNMSASGDNVSANLTAIFYLRKQ